VGKLTEGGLTYDVLYQEGAMVAYGKTINGGRTIDGRAQGQCTSILVDSEVVGLKKNKKKNKKRNGGERLLSFFIYFLFSVYSFYFIILCLSDQLVYPRQSTPGRYAVVYLLFVCHLFICLGDRLANSAQSTCDTTPVLPDTHT
jgi:hypothetical protein